MTEAHHALTAVFAGFEGHGGPAYRHTDGELGYHALFVAARRLARGLAGPGAAAGGPVLIYGHKDRRFVVAYWACLLAGRACVPVEPDLPAARVVAIAALTGARLLLIAHPAMPAALAAALAAEGVALDTVRVDADPGGDAVGWSPRAVPDEAVAYILFSSGTTGAPKGIQVSYANLADFVAWMHGLTAEYGPVGCVSGNVRYCFDVSLFELWLAWINRAPISTWDHADLWNLGLRIERFAAHGLATWVSTPALAAQFLKHPRFDRAHLPQLRTMLFCGEVLSKTLVEELFRRFDGVRIVNTYGPTECTVAVTSVEITRAHLAAPAPLPIGAPRPGTTVSAVPARPGDARGELVIAGRAVGPGYLGAPERQAALFAGGSYRTGDWGHQGEDGLWYFEGRCDREVKVQGHRIDLNAVENTIRRSAGVVDAVVAVDGEAPQVRGLRAFVVGPRSPEDLSAVAASVAALLPPHCVPRVWYGHDRFTVNVNGKMDRSALQAELSASGARYVHAVHTVAAT